MKSLFPQHMSLVGTVLDMQLQRQNVIMGNIANVNTPRYKPRTLEFENELQSALNLDIRGKLSRTEEGHVPSTFDPEKFGPEWYKTCRPQVVYGEDRVDLDKEMVKLTKNNLQYTALAQITKQGFDGIKQIIAEGGK